MAKNHILTLCAYLMGLSLDSQDPANALDKPERYHWPDSEADSKKHGNYTFSVMPMPNQFTWEGHKVEIFECWFERRKTRLFFRLKIDDDINNESRLWRQENKQIWFMRQDMMCSADFNGTTHHSISFPSPDTTRVKVRVGTKSSPGEPAICDTEINFDWSYNYLPTKL